MEQSPIATRVRLIEARKNRLWSQQELADLLGTTQNTVSRWEMGTTTPNPYFTKKLCEIFGQSTQELGLIPENPSPLGPKEHEEAGAMPTPASHTDMLALWTVPYPRNRHFTGREDLLGLLVQRLSPEEPSDPVRPRRAALTQPQAIKGLGGIGKTQIAVEYAYRAREQGRYTHILWINAASKEAMITSFVQLAELLLAFPIQQEQDQRQLIAAIIRWFEHCQQRWLLIFDNADDISLLDGYLPTQGHGSLLLTTRAHAVGSLASSIDVEKMGFEEGVQLLLRRAQRLTCVSDEETKAAGEIVVALDHFPLALDQAGAYIEETSCTFSSYLHLYHEHRQVLLARRGKQTTHYPDSVATTWSLSFQQLAQNNPAALELLHLCAFLAPDAIPEELLRDGAAHWPPLLQQATTDPFLFNQMLEDVLKFSLVERFVDTHTLRIHRLVQAVQRDQMEPEEQRHWAECAVRAVNEAFPHKQKEDITVWPQCLRYLEQVQACDLLIRHYILTFTEAADVLHRAGTYLSYHASYAAAEPLLRHALEFREQLLNGTHPDTARTLYELASFYHYQEKYVEAEWLYQRALTIQEPLLDATTSPDAALTLSNLASLYHRQGKREQAEPLYQRALTIGEQQLGVAHHSMVHTLNMLAILYYEQGKYEQAEPLFHRAFAISEQSLDPTNPNTARTLQELAHLSSLQRKYEQAELLLKRALAIREQQLGNTHPSTAQSLSGLAELYFRQGKYEQAEPSYQRALAIWEQRLEVGRPDAVRLLSSLAHLYFLQEKYEQAEPLLKHALAICEQQFGTTYPDAINALNLLAMLYYEQGKYEQAEPLHQRALAISEQQLDTAHSPTGWTLYQLAVLYCYQKKYEQAEPLLKRALAIYKQQLGSVHPYTVLSSFTLAHVYGLQGKYEQAELLYQRALAIWEQQFGSIHPYTAQTLNRLANLYSLQGKYEQAESLYQNASTIWEQLEVVRPGTAVSLHNLARLYHDQGKYEQAEPLYRRAFTIREQILGSQHPETIETCRYLNEVLQALCQS